MGKRTRADEQKSAKAEAKRQRRMQRKAAREQAVVAAARRRRVRNVALVAVAAAAVALVVVFAFGSDSEIEGVEKPPDEGREHLAVGQSTSYSSAAPTSGPHSPQAPRCGFYNSQLPLEQAVHALEHGAVVLWYRPDVEEEVRPELMEIASQWDSHVIVSPNTGITDPIVATAWNRRLSYDDPSGVGQFVDTYRRRGPERVDCDF